MQRKELLQANVPGEEMEWKTDNGICADPRPKHDPGVLRDRWLRAAADLDNRREDLIQRARLACKSERIALFRQLLMVIDGLEEALNWSDAQDNGDTCSDGIRTVHGQMRSLLARVGAQAIGARGDRFNPNIHKAIGLVGIPHQPLGRVAEVLQVGYRTRDGIILRPAKVTVVQHLKPVK